jgi:hypothetical protein
VSRTVIGTKYTPWGQQKREEFRAKNGYYPDDDRLVELNTRVKDLWPDSEIELHRELLMAFYIVSITLSAACVIAVTQALSCAMQPQRSNPFRH